MSHPPLDLRTAEAMLAHVDGCEDRETWVSVGMALKSEFGMDAFNAWDQWSANAANYSEKSCRSSWKGFKARNGAGVTIGTLIKLAMDGGFTFDRSQQPALDPAELQRRRQKRAQRIAAEQADRARLAQSAEQQALATWRAALREGTSAYCTRKGIDAPESCRYLPEQQGGGIVLPMLRYDLPREQSLKGVQIIRDDGSKKFTYGMLKPGTACRLGLAVVGEPVFVCEGYATGMTIRMALARRFAVFVAWDAYNLVTVVDAVHQALPDNPMVICADDDHKTMVKGLSNNVGRIQAQIALDGVMDGTGGARLVCRTYPVFKKETARGDKDTDFNDLQRLEGLAEVTEQLELCLITLTELAKHG